MPQVIVTDPNTTPMNSIKDGDGKMVKSSMILENIKDHKCLECYNKFFY